MKTRLLLLLGSLAALAASRAAPLTLGTQLEPFFDDYLIADLQGVSRVAGVPVRVGPALACDQPWEGRYTGYFTVLKDGPLYRLYYRGYPSIDAGPVTCYAESDDGLTWRKPALGLHAWHDRRDTNIILAGEKEASENFTPFLDANPAAAPDERFKAVGGGKGGLRAFASADGVHWRPLQEAPVLTNAEFDSQNVPFWSGAEGCYVLYFREWTGAPNRDRRTIARTTSPDFRHWAPPQLMVFDGAPPEQLYTNVTQPYYRAPQLSVALPSRFVPGRQWLDPAEAQRLAVPEGREHDVSDVVLLTTRGGLHYHRVLPGAFLRPGPDERDWVGRSNMVALGLVPAAGGGMGFYRQHHYASSSNHLELYTVREDGLAFLRGGPGSGTVRTKPFVAAGTGLWLNYATSAAGHVTVEVLDENGAALPGWGVATLYGDRIAREATWPGGTKWAALAGRTLCLRFTLDDADLFSLQQR